MRIYRRADQTAQRGCGNADRGCAHRARSDVQRTDGGAFEEIEAVTDETKKTSKEAAAQHLAMAKAAMAKNDESGCVTLTDTGLNMMHGD
jgi:hypothetical protein